VLAPAEKGLRPALAPLPPLVALTMLATSLNARKSGQHVATGFHAEDDASHRQYDSSHRQHLQVHGDARVYTVDLKGNRALRTDGDCMNLDAKDFDNGSAISVSAGAAVVVTGVGGD